MTLPTTMHYAAAREARPARRAGRGRRPAAGDQARRSADRGRLCRRQPSRLPAAFRRLSTAAGRVAGDRARGLRAHRRARRRSRAVARRRRGLRAYARRRVRRVLRHARRLLPAGSDRGCRCGGRGRAGELLHRLVQPVRPAALRRRRVGADPRRHQRHRSHRDPAHARLSEPSCSPRRDRTKRSRSARPWAPTMRSITRPRTSSRKSRASTASAA